ncbi:MAG TPA: hypothetical protein VMI73_06590 [Trebonia sp.]|nr:hypothetical protein [Trebonia sp.]
MRASWPRPAARRLLIAAHRVGDALDPVAELRADPVERVRIAAARAVTLLTAAGAQGKYRIRSSGRA